MLQDGSKPITAMTFLDGRVENTGHLLAALHPPFAFNLWDTSSGQKIWKKTYAETLQGFDIDPFDHSRIAFRCIECILFINDFDPNRMPTSPGKKFYVMGSQFGQSSAGSGSVTTTPSVEDKSRVTRTRLKRMMKEFVTGEAGPISDEAITLSDCLQVVFHRSARDHILLVYSREILILDLDIGQTVGFISLDRSSPSIVRALSTSQRDAIFILNESGSVSLRHRKKLYSLVSNAFPSSPRRNLPPDASRSSSVASTPMLNVGDNSSDVLAMDNLLEIVYDQKACSENVKLPKNTRVLGFCMNPMSEKSFVTFTTEGRLIFTDLSKVSLDNKKSNNQVVSTLCLEDIIPSSFRSVECPAVRMHTSAIMTGLLQPPFVIRMCPPLTMKVGWSL